MKVLRASPCERLSRRKVGLVRGILTKILIDRFQMETESVSLDLRCYSLIGLDQP